MTSLLVLQCHVLQVSSCNSIVGKIAKTEPDKWAEHMVRMKDERLPKRSETKKQEGNKTRNIGLCEDRRIGLSKERQMRKKSGEKRPTTE